MSGVLVVAEIRRGEVREISHQLISCAVNLAEQGCRPVSVAIVAPDPEAHADALNVAGVDAVLLVRSPCAHYDAGIQRVAIRNLIAQENPDVVLAGHSVDAMGFAPALAAELDLGLASDALSVEWVSERPVVQRGAYGDRLLARVEFPDRDEVLVMVRDGAYAPAEAGGGSAEIKEADFSLDPGAVVAEHLGFTEAESGEVDISEAEFLLAIGRGIEDEENVAQFERLAEVLGATLAVSRPLVDAGWMHASRQVGQSGAVVKPKVYLALGISGAVQHLAGIRGAQTVIAVNSDPEAPIFSVADYGAVIDLFDVADELPAHFS